MKSSLPNSNQFIKPDDEFIEGSVTESDIDDSSIVDDDQLLNQNVNHHQLIVFGENKYGQCGIPYSEIKRRRLNRKNKVKSSSQNLFEQNNSERSQYVGSQEAYPEMESPLKTSFQFSAEKEYEQSSSEDESSSDSKHTSDDSSSASQSSSFMSFKQNNSVDMFDPSDFYSGIQRGKQVGPNVKRKQSIASEASSTTESLDSYSENLSNDVLPSSSVLSSMGKASREIIEHANRNQSVDSKKEIIPIRKDNLIPKDQTNQSKTQKENTIAGSPTAKTRTRHKVINAKETGYGEIMQDIKKRKNEKNDSYKSNTLFKNVSLFGQFFNDKSKTKSINSKKNEAPNKVDDEREELVEKIFLSRQNLNNRLQKKVTELSNNDSIHKDMIYYPSRVNTGSLTHGDCHISLIATSEKKTYIYTSENRLYACGENKKSALGLGISPATPNSPLIKDEFSLYENISKEEWDKRLKNNVTEFVELVEPWDMLQHRITHLSTCNTHAIAVTEDNRIWICFPVPERYTNNKSVLSKNIFFEAKPQILNEEEQIKFLKSGKKHTIIVTDKNNIYALGSNKIGQCGLGNSIKKTNGNIMKLSLPSHLKESGIKHLACGSHHTMLVTKDNFVYACGCNLYYQLGVSSDYEEEKLHTLISKTKKRCNSLGNLEKEISHSQLETRTHSMSSLKRERRTFFPKFIPIPLYGQDSYEMYLNRPVIRKLACSAFHSMIVVESNKIYATGTNLFGQCCTNSWESSHCFEQIKSAGTVLKDKVITSLSCGYAHTLIFAVANTKDIDQTDILNTIIDRKSRIKEANDFLEAQLYVSGSLSVCQLDTLNSCEFVEEPGENLSWKLTPVLNQSFKMKHIKRIQCAGMHSFIETMDPLDVKSAIDVVKLILLKKKNGRFDILRKAMNEETLATVASTSTIEQRKAQMVDHHMRKVNALKESLSNTIIDKSNMNLNSFDVQDKEVKEHMMKELFRAFDVLKEATRIELYLDLFVRCDGIEVITKAMVLHLTYRKELLENAVDILKQCCSTGKNRIENRIKIKNVIRREDAYQYLPFLQTLYFKNIYLKKKIRKLQVFLHTIPVLQCGILSESFVIHSRLGEGAEGMVFSAQHKKSKRFYAVKVLKCMQGEENYSIPWQEADKIVESENLVQLQSLDHPNLVNHYDYFVEPVESNMVTYSSILNPNRRKRDNSKLSLEGKPRCKTVIVMHFHKDGTLEDYLFDRIAKDLHFSEIEIIHFMYQLVSGLKHLHRSNLLHRDLKHANILCGNNSLQLRIADFGTMFNLEDNKSMSLAGSFHFLAPEALRNPKSYSFESDIFSLGCIMYYMMIFEMNTMVSKRVEDDEKSFMRIAKHEFKKLGYSVPLQKLVLSMIRKVPKKRMSLKEISNQLNTLRSQHLEEFDQLNEKMYSVDSISIYIEHVESLSRNENLRSIVQQQNQLIQELRQQLNNLKSTETVNSL